jgi:hypothetical protein
MSQKESLLEELTQKVDDFVFDHHTWPNAILLSLENIETLADVDRVLIKDKLPTIICLIPIDSSLPFDLPLPVLLPVIATKRQRAQSINLESREL